MTIKEIIARISAKDSRYKRYIGKPIVHCIHLGLPTGEIRSCKACTKTIEIPLFNCAIHSLCTENKLLPQVACCRICNDKEVIDQIIIHSLKKEKGNNEK